jgi:hypothetical protein
VPRLYGIEYSKQVTPEAADAIPHTMALGTANSISRRMAQSRRKLAIVLAPRSKAL